MNDTAALRRDVEILKTKVMALENEQRRLDKRIGTAIELIKQVETHTHEVYKA